MFIMLSPFQFHRLNYKYDRTHAEDSIILMTTRHASDSLIATREFQIFRRLGIKVIPVALGRKRFAISMELQQMTGFVTPYVASYRRLQSKEYDVIRDICPVVGGIPGKLVSCTSNERFKFSRKAKNQMDVWKYELYFKCSGQDISQVSKANE